MSKKVSVGATLAVAALAVAITFCVTVNLMTDRFNRQLGELQTLENTYEKMQELTDTVTQNAYYAVADTSISDNTGRAYAASLREAGDRYANYYTAEEYAANETASAGGAQGIGITVCKEESGATLVYNVIHGSPAYTAGVKAGDVILAVSDGEGTKQAEGDYDALCEAMKEAEGPLTLSLRRGEEELEMSVTPADYTVTSAYMERVGSVAVVRITAFHADTDEQFVSLINEIENDSSITGVVFDVRNNGGGLLTSVVNMLDRLLPEGVIVTEKDKNGTEVQRFDSDATCLNLPMMVLTNGSTASASELFACALRDYGKAKLVGEATYGKGCVQTTYTFSDGSALTFTTALYFPPASVNFDGTPLEPDVAVSLTEEQNLAFYTLTAETDPQLAAALEQLAARVSNAA